VPERERERGGGSGRESEGVNECQREREILFFLRSSIFFQFGINIFFIIHQKEKAVRF
jgi:hypothetical protein